MSPERVRALTEYHIRKGVKGVYVNGSSGECIYQSLEDRKITLENVMGGCQGQADGHRNMVGMQITNQGQRYELAKHGGEPWR